MMTRGRDDHDDHGAATVEFALTLPLLMCLILGVITGGITLNQKIAVTNGVREGSRFGATLSVVSGCPSGPATMTCWLTQVADVTQAAAEGELNYDVASRSICVAYVHPSETTIPTDRTTRLVRDAAGDTVTVGSTCFAASDGRPDTERRVQVTGQRAGSIEYFFGTARPTLSSDSVTKFEAT